MKEKNITNIDERKFETNIKNIGAITKNIMVEIEKMISFDMETAYFIYNSGKDLLNAYPSAEEKYVNSGVFESILDENYNVCSYILSRIGLINLALMVEKYNGLNGRADIFENEFISLQISLGNKIGFYDVLELFNYLDIKLTNCSFNFKQSFLNISFLKENKADKIFDFVTILGIFKINYIKT